MKILILTPNDHYYSPYTIDLINTKNEIIVISTPTLNKNETITKIIRRSGFIFLYHMLIMKIIIYLRRLYGKEKNLKSVCKNKGMQFIPIDKINDSVEIIKNMKPKIIFSLFFNQIIKKEVISIPKYFLNVHPSLLPKYRGVSPIFWVLKNNEKTTGTSIHLLDDGIDTGDIVFQKSIEITSNDTFHSLYKKSALIAADLINRVIYRVGKNRFKCKKQKESEATYFTFYNKQDVKNFLKKRKFI